MAAQESDSTTAKTTSQEFSLFSEFGPLSLPVESKEDGETHFESLENETELSETSTEPEEWKSEVEEQIPEVESDDREDSVASADEELIETHSDEGVAFEESEERLTAAVETPETVEDAPEALPALPSELGNVAKALEKARNDPGQLPGAFANFCAAAYVKPEWAGAASEYLAVFFADHEDLLAEMTRVPDLIIELGSGHYTLTFMVASRWAAKADLARLTRLAEALIATQSKMGCPEVVDLMLALTTSLAVSRYSRAEHLLDAAKAHITPDQQEALEEARLWLGAGLIVRGCSQDARDLWDQRLRRPRVEWTWNEPEEYAALTQLSEYLSPKADSARLFKAIVPVCWWNLLIARTREREELEAALATKKQERFEPETPIGTPKQVVRQPIIIWRGIPFFIGGIVGAWALVLGIWLGPYDLVRNPVVNEATAAAVDSGVATASTAVENAEVELPENPNAIWRKQQVASMAAEAPELRALAERIEIGDWTQHEAFLKGETAELPKSDPRYQKLLLWLHLDPPSNEEIRKQIPLLLSALRQDSTVIELWEKLVYPGSLNAKDIQAAALRTQHENKEAWSPTQRALLTQIGTVSLKTP
ncbi:MAG: hypothetical protein OJI67_12320 [Prosthecobacter sp.]|nr:hypothetical protein [Prosthecobacter sp.]